MSKKIKFITVVALQILLILSIAIYKYSISVNGTEVVLNIKPIDPRDLLRGDYVTFQYDISNVYNYGSYGKDTKKIKNGMTVYVELRNYGGNIWAAGEVFTTKPDRDKMVFLKGTVVSGGMPDQPSDQQLTNNAVTGKSPYYSSELHIAYGIEQFYIPEGSGRNFSFAGKDAKAKVAVDKNGNAVLKKINVDGKNWP